VCCTEATPDYYAESNSGSQQEDGYSIWNTVAAAASTLTVSVSKAWTRNVVTANGEGERQRPLAPYYYDLRTENVETPPGQDSRLTRAMKAYHLEKAKDPSDLPLWLFPEQGRRSTNDLKLADRQEDGEYEENSTSNPLPKSRGLRDIYAAAAASSPPPTPSSAGVERGKPVLYPNEGVVPSKAVDRLKALRDAKRGALVPTKPQVSEPVRPLHDKRRPIGREGVKPTHPPRQMRDYKESDRSFE